jgi:hypothetical protein
MHLVSASWCLGARRRSRRDLEERLRTRKAGCPRAHAAGGSGARRNPPGRFFGGRRSVGAACPRPVDCLDFSLLVGAPATLQKSGRERPRPSKGNCLEGAGGSHVRGSSAVIEERLRETATLQERLRGTTTLQERCAVGAARHGRSAAQFVAGPAPARVTCERPWPQARVTGVRPAPGRRRGGLRSP